MTHPLPETFTLDGKTITKIEEGYVQYMYTDPVWGDDIEHAPIILGDDNKIYEVHDDYELTEIDEENEDFLSDMCEQPEFYIAARGQEQYEHICKQYE